MNMNSILKKIAGFTGIMVLALGLASCSNTGMSQKVKDNYLLIPAAEHGTLANLEVTVDGVNILGEPQVVIVAEGEPDYYIPVDVRAYKGKQADVTLSKITLGPREVPVPIEGMVEVEIRQVEAYEYDYNEPYRPVYHFSPNYGWTNDPNGMVYSDGEWHLAYQANPYGTRHFNMHWGNAVSKDLVHWEDLPFIVAPDSLGAIFSGSAVEDTYNSAGFGEKALIGMYTSAGTELQQQSIAYSTDKGRTYTKYEANPVISDFTRYDFRDPKIIRYEDKWVVAVAAGEVISFYESDNLIDWTKTSEFGKGIGSHAAVWECPDLLKFEYNGKTKWVLFVSINPGGPNGGSVTQYFIGDFDGKKYTADPLPYPLWIDEGMDNYAGVTFANTGDRYVFMGWMSNWYYSQDVPTKYFRNAMTIARDLSLKHNGKHLFLASDPSPEILAARQEPVNFDVKKGEAAFVAENALPASGAYEMTFTVTPDKSGKKQTLRLYNSLGEEMLYTFDFDKLSLSLDRSKSGNVDFNPRFSNADIRTSLVKRGEYKVRLFVDRHSTELFVNDGDLSFTNTMFPTEPYTSFEMAGVDGGLNVSDLVVYELK